MANCVLERNRGTVNSNLYGAPDELKTPGDCEKISAAYYFAAEKGGFCLHSYTVKTKSKRKNNVLLFFTVRPMHKK